MFAFLHLIHGLSTSENLTELRGASEVTTFPTLIVLYVIAYLVFDTSDGLRASLLLYGASLALVLAGAAANGFGNLSGSEISWIAQTYAFMGAVVVLLYATAFAKTQLSRERTLTEAMSHLALTDQLTGVSNRRKLYMDLHHEIESARRYDHPLSVILFDLDHFKKINDSHGHDRGDEVLREVVKEISPLLRKIDHFGRWGGEEFILIAPETTLDRASNLAERLRHAIANISPENEITASFGTAEHTPDDTPESFIKRADEALYTAKAAGRNRVESF
jgi:diguanylate cyclase (GGDEF)-like protein